ncbi:MAG: hypothetical protein ACTSPQ_20165 [Candidatus Helarchaeota archaeon]
MEVHIHIGLGEEGISKEDSAALMIYIHDYLSFIMVLYAKSSVFPRGNNQPKLTSNSSNRLLIYRNQ